MILNCILKKQKVFLNSLITVFSWIYERRVCLMSLFSATCWRTWIAVWPDRVYHVVPNHSVPRPSNKSKELY